MIYRYMSDGLSGECNIFKYINFVYMFSLKNA